MWFRFGGPPCQTGAQVHPLPLVTGSWRSGHELVPPVVAEEPLDALPVLQPRLAEGQQHPVDAADLQPHVTGQDLRGSTR